MQFIGADEKPLGVINWFAVHPTSMNNTNHLVSSDNVGYASIIFEKAMNQDSLVGKVRRLFSVGEDSVSCTIFHPSGESVCLPTIGNNSLFIWKIFI